MIKLISTINCLFRIVNLQKNKVEDGKNIGFWRKKLQLLQCLS